MSPSMAQHDIFRDQVAINYPVYGHALWEPNPGGLYHAIEVGDVGYILQGKFLRLFNALLPADHPSHEKCGVPDSHELLKPSIADHHLALQGLYQPGILQIVNMYKVDLLCLIYMQSIFGS